MQKNLSKNKLMRVGKGWFAWGSPGMPVAIRLHLN